MLSHALVEYLIVTQLVAFKRYFQRHTLCLLAGLSQTAAQLVMMAQERALKYQ